MTTEQQAALPIIGHDLAVVEAFAKKVHALAAKNGDYTECRETDSLRGVRFDVRLETGHVVRVTIELDRLEQISHA